MYLSASIAAATLALASSTVATPVVYDPSQYPVVNATNGTILSPSKGEGGNSSSTQCPNGGPDTIFGKLSSDPSYSNLTALLNKTDLLKCTLDNSSATTNLTLFAPTNEAFDNMTTSLGEFLQSPAGGNILSLLLGYHVAQNTTLNTTELSSNGTNVTCPTEIGLNVTASPIDANTTVINGDVPVANTSMYASNGAIVPISGILEPFQDNAGNDFTNFTLIQPQKNSTTGGNNGTTGGNNGTTGGNNGTTGGNNGSTGGNQTQGSGFVNPFSNLF
ncbi:MAG: FAS1 domain-containing protein [Piptocephalis tieghemiana]|nr:MAG: FAS1 domain-containing protein [Piptocephalis tieghemiana]